MSTYYDQMGRKIVMPHPPQRIISLVPSQTELLFYLGLEKEIVGITKFCVHPEEQFRSKPRIGGTKQLNLDKIAELQPDLIIGNKEENEQSQMTYLAQHYPVWMSDVVTLEDAYEMITEVGKLTNRQKESVDLVKNIQLSFSKWINPNRKPLTAAYFIWQKPYMVVGKNTFINEMMGMIGFNNIFANQDRYPEISLEDLAMVAPQIVLLSSEPFPFKEKHIETFQNACPAAIIKLVDGELFSWYGNRLLLFGAYAKRLWADIEY